MGEKCIVLCGLGCVVTFMLVFSGNPSNEDDDVKEKEKSITIFLTVCDADGEGNLRHPASVRCGHWSVSVM